MSKWQELGEIPDSEDEDGFDDGFDSMDLVPIPAITASQETHHEEKESSPVNDVWDIPDSSLPELEVLPISKASKEPSAPQQSQQDDLDSSPLSSLRSDVDMLSYHGMQDTFQPDNEPATLRLSDIRPQSPESEDELSLSYPLIPQPVDNPEPMIEPAVTSNDIETSAPAVSSQAEPSQPLMSQELGYESDEQIARRAAVRYQRSLRPRKPIQEHPYMLENAQYSSFLRQHGVKPLRMAIEAEKRRRQQEDSQPSQDKDFEDESQGSRVPEISDESQLQGLENFLNELDGWDFPSPTPPRTSPRNDRARPSSQLSTAGNTDITAMEDEELPDFADLLPKGPSTHSKRASKRQSSPPTTIRRKRKRHDIIESDPLEPAANLRFVSNIDDSPTVQRIQRRSASPHNQGEDWGRTGDSPSPLRDKPRVLEPNSSPPARPMVIDSESENDRSRQRGVVSSEDEGSSSDTGNESGSEIVNTLGRRIKGVLPASWLRLDQHSGRANPQKEAMRRVTARSPERDQRRGVAQRRQAAPGTLTQGVFFFDDSDDEGTIGAEPTTDEQFHNQTRLVLHEADFPPSLEGPTLDSDEGASVIEEDYVDRMMPGKKRQLKLSESLNRQQPKSKSRTKQPTRLSGKATQPRITSHFGETHTIGSSPLRRIKKKYRHGDSGGKAKDSKSRRSRKAGRPLPAPRLSILDVIEPDAPRFLKIAARAAASRQNQGRSSPSRKFIQLATREDHIDAMSVLKKWQEGSIPQRPSVSAAKRLKQAQRRVARPLGEVSGNQPSQKQPSASSTAAPRKLVKHTSNGGSVRYQPTTLSQPPTSKQQHRAQKQLGRASSGVARFAQLETDQVSHGGRAAFQATKQRLDRLYRSQRQNLSASSILDMNGADFEPDPTSPPPEENPVPVRTVEEALNGRIKKSRFRKKTKPKQIDVEAPQYSRANDPLPVEQPVIQDLPSVEPGTKKLLGLGPYGTQYSHHFETFPLDARVYFHQSTLIGSGAIVKASTTELGAQLLETRPCLSYSFGDLTLRWGTWDAQVSSELGILLDHVAEQLSQIGADDTFPLTSPPTTAAAFIQRYVQDALNFSGNADLRHFASRALETFKSFDGRISTLVSMNDSSRQALLQSAAQTYDYLLVAAFAILQLCQSDASLVGEQFHFKLEELLGDLTRTCVSALFKLGFDQLRQTYQELGDAHFRDRGLRESSVIHSWVVVMKILDLARIPRGSFWDVTYKVMATPSTVDALDAQEHERLWKKMFALLPLSEFTNDGIIVPGSRYDVLVDGWSLPQKLLKKVFQLYRENVHQSSSFNTYCRALVGRCHYLVQQWGWRKCAGTIGIIFDFFGSQNLAHLRNEEVSGSPRFLEELANEPSLDVEPADRCFHILLKLIALSIRKLREIGALKDIRNLVTRTMPNHNRQYLKEQNVHERDLFALCNHHDLLCTLFWASPPDLRPATQIIERLVIPESSHKEACLINLRAWKQLSRFIMASGEATTAFKPFGQWRNTFFQQMMQQFSSVESDIHQQYLTLSKDVSNTISQSMMDQMVKTNKAAVMDVLYYSASASLDVMRHAPDLEAAAFALNSRQLQQIFKHFAVSPPELDWGVLRVSLATLSAFLSRIDDFKNDEESQQSESQLLNSAQADDAIMVVDNDIASSFFSMARCILSSRGNRGLSASAAMDKAHCSEEVVTISAKLGLHFMQGGLLRLSDMFKFGKYGLFEGVPAQLNLYQRKYLVLFMVTLLKGGYDDLTGAGFSIIELWILSILKPRAFLSYENQLAELLRSQGQAFVPEAVAGLAINPDYNTNRDLFEFVISYMRKSARDAGPILKKIIVPEHTKTLKAAMQQMKNDLKEMVQDKTGHPPYVSFVREIVSLIRAHGSDFCPIDDFYYQISKEYSPSMQDPQLQLAGIMAYGLRLSEGEKVAMPLFYLLLNNFKSSLNSDKLGEEVKFLQRSFKNKGIFAFIAGKMMPAIIRAGLIESSVYPLLDVYAEALRYLLSKSEVPHELTEDDLPDLVPVIKSVLLVMFQGRERDNYWGHEHWHIFRRCLGIMNDLWHPIFVLSLTKPKTPTWREALHLLNIINTALKQVESYVESLATSEDNRLATPSVLLRGFPQSMEGMDQIDEQVRSLTNLIIGDVRKNWSITDTRISIQAPSRARSTTQSQVLCGTAAPVWNNQKLMESLWEMMKEYNEWCWKTVHGSLPKRHPIMPIF